MALFNYATKEITLKIVYYGPGLSGKTTNLQHLHSILNPSTTGKLLSLSTEADRTLFFDFLPVELGKIRDFSIRFQLYTVPGQVRYNATRRIVLKGADAVIFVADSQRDMREQNIDSFDNMMENLSSNNIRADEIPIVLQYNKRDLPNILSADELNSELNKDTAYPVTEAIALKGTGVEETYKLVTKLLLKNIARKHKVEIQPVPEKEERKEPVQTPPQEAPERQEILPSPRFAAGPAMDIQEAFPLPVDSVVTDVSVPEPEEEDVYAIEVEEEAPSSSESLTEPPLAEWSAADIFPDAKEEPPPPKVEKIPSFAESIAEPAVPPLPASDIFAKMEKEPHAEKIEKIPSFAESIAETAVPPLPASDIFAEMERESQPLKKEIPPEVVEKKKEVLIKEVREVPVFPVEKIDIINQRIEKLSALLTEVNNTLARMSTSLSLHETALREMKENRDLREMRREHGEINVLLKNLVSFLNSLKEKKRWFRF